MKMRLAAAVSLLVMTVLPAVAEEAWQTGLREAIEFQKDEWNQGYEADGVPERLAQAELADTDAFQYELVSPQQPWELTLGLEPGTDYVVMAVCDEDCYDIDLLAFRDGERDPIGEDTEEDAVPVLEFEARGDETLRLVLVDCAVDRCYAAVGVFEKRR